STFTTSSTVAPRPSVREHGDALDRATHACDSVLRLLDSQEPNGAAYNLLCRELALLDADPAAATRAQALAFRLKLLLAAGFAPELTSCASCGDREHLSAYSASAGGVVCPGCEAGSFPLDGEAHRFLVEAM